MVPSLPFVLINGNTDLPRMGNKNITGELKKERERERENVGKYISVWFQMEQRIFQIQNQGSNQLFPKASHLKEIDTQI
jgi:hypothetical protein